MHPNNRGAVPLPLPLNPPLYSYDAGTAMGNGGVFAFLPFSHFMPILPFGKRRFALMSIA